ncbi:MAG: hypothetical protein ACRDTS_16515 [Mycobacterium sp.]
MFGHGFATQIIAPASQGQPEGVSAAVSWAAHLINAHPVGWDALFASVQLALGLALLIRPLARVGLAASICWALGVWDLGEGLGGLSSGRWRSGETCHHEPVIGSARGDADAASSLPP